MSKDYYYQANPSSQPREPHLWSLRLENFNLWGSLAGELQPMRPDPIEPSLESSVKNSPVIENFGNSPVV